MIIKRGEQEIEDIIYFDRFAKEYTKTKENIAPPERYLEIYKSLGDYYKEVWSAIFYGDKKLNLRLSISYDEKDKKYANVIREEKAKEEDVVLERQLIWYVPKNVYQEILKYL